MATVSTTRFALKPFSIDVLIEVLNSDLKPDHIGKLVDRSGNTVRKYLKQQGPFADLWRRRWMAEKVVAAGLVGTAEEFESVPLDDGEIAAIIGLHHWRKCRHVVAEMRRNHEPSLAGEAEIERLQIVAGCIERHVAQARAGGPL